MAKEMVKIPDGLVLYAGAGAYRGKAPKALYEEYLAGVAKAKEAKAKAQEAPKPRAK